MLVGNSFALQNHDFFDKVLTDHPMGRDIYTIAEKDLRDAVETAKSMGVTVPLVEFAADFLKTSFYERADVLGLK